MTERLYDDLAPWWPVLSPPETYAEEAAFLVDQLQRAVDGPLERVLELGAGGGHLASHLPASLEVVLVDRAPAMLAQSRALNPGRAHIQADLRSLRLDRSFDGVLLHDAVMYLTTEEDLARAFATAAAHCRPGAAFLVLPDVVKESFGEQTLGGGGEEGDRAARMMEWHWDPDPTDDTFQVEMAYLLREGRGPVRSVHETHVMGLFSRDTWWRLLGEAGFEPVEATPRPEGELFLTRRR